MPPVHVLIKPVSASCNMRCSYCFYNDVTAHRTTPCAGVLSFDTLEQIIAKAMAYADYICTFAFQGGEPTLVGLDFYRQVLAFEDKYHKQGVKVFHAIQTNGYALDEKWAEFLSRHHFLVGLSLDGPAALHDQNRKTQTGAGTFNRVMKTVQLFKKYKVEYNVLSVVTGKNAQSVQRIYQFFKKQDFRWIQFLPCLEPLSQRRGLAQYALSPRQYGEFLVRIFDLWYRDLLDGQYYSIRHLDNYLSILLGHKPEACSMNGRCSVQFMIEADGSVYPCDFYGLDNWKIGSVLENTFSEMAASETSTAFLKISEHVPQQCQACPYYALCRNGCRRERLESGGVPELNYYCNAYQFFFSQRLSGLMEAAERILTRSAAMPSIEAAIQTE